MLSKLAEAALRWAAGRELELAGVLVAAEYERAWWALQRCGYQLAGVYRIFVRPLGW